MIGIRKTQLSHSALPDRGSTVKTKVTKGRDAALIRESTLRGHLTYDHRDTSRLGHITAAVILPVYSVHHWTQVKPQEYRI